MVCLLPPVDKRFKQFLTKFSDAFGKCPNPWKHEQVALLHFIPLVTESGGRPQMFDRIDQALLIPHSIIDDANFDL